jgi:SAM-dependent methyltransferase
LGFLQARLRDPYQFFSASPLHDFCLHRLERRLGQEAVVLYRFLCAGEEVTREELGGVLSAADLDDLQGAGLLLARGDRFLLAVRLVPYRDYCYVGPCHQLIKHRALYGVEPPCLGEQTHWQIVLLEQFLRRRRCARMLELGSGTGLVSLEMRPFVPQREGAEIAPLSLEYARANQELRGDGGVSFYQSDLFGSVSGTFDLVVFNPWQPSEGALPLIVRFLRELPEFLTTNGTALLLIDSLLAEGRDDVLREVSEVLGEHSFMARRQVLAFYRSRRDARGGGVAAVSALWIMRGTGGRIRPLRDLEWLKFSVRSLVR